MTTTAPRADDPYRSAAPGGDPSLGTGASPTAAERSELAQQEADRAAATFWNTAADEYQAEHGTFLAEFSATAPPAADPAAAVRAEPDRAEQHGSNLGRPRAGAGFVWGPEGVAEQELSLLGPVGRLAGRRVLEVGCGAAQCSAWLAQRGVRATGIDISVNQLRHAPTPHAPTPRVNEPGQGGGAGTGARGSLNVAAATATALPFRDRTFSAAFSAYGAVQFVADLAGLLAEVRRVLEPGAPWVFSVTHPIRWAFPDEPGPEGLAVSASYFDRTPYVERDDTGTAVYAEFHRTVGDYVGHLRRAGFTIENLVEPEWPEWNEATWGGWSQLRGLHLPGTLIMVCRTDAEDLRGLT